MLKNLTFLFCLAYFCFPLSAQSLKIKQIKIQSNEVSILIKREADGFYNQDGIKIEEKLIQNLFRAINEPTIYKPTISNFGITKEWLEENAENGFDEYASESFKNAAPNQQALYYSSFKNPKFIQSILPDIYNYSWSHDYPQVDVELLTETGSSIKVHSRNQQTFMLPLLIQKGKRKFKTYNANISRSIAAFLPENHYNKRRLSGENLNSVLSNIVMSAIENDWELLNAENNAGEDLKKIRTKFIVKTGDINNYHNINYGVAWDTGEPREANLHLTLKRKEFPSYFSIGAVLPFDWRMKTTGDLLNKSDKYIKLSLSVTWLNQFLNKHPETEVELRFVGSSSISQKAIKSFVEDMKELGKKQLANEVLKNQADVSLLKIGDKYFNYAYWIVLPSRKMILWRNAGQIGLLKWKLSNFTFTECDYSIDCSGALDFNFTTTVGVENIFSLPIKLFTVSMNISPYFTPPSCIRSLVCCCCKHFVRRDSLADYIDGCSRFKK